MAYSDIDEIDMGDAQENDGVNRDNGFFTDNGDNSSTSNADLVDELNAFLMSPRFDNDVCVTLTMPVAALKKAKEKINAAVVKVYERHKSPDFKMFDVLIALESMVDAPVISSLLDIDIKRVIAADRGIVISDQQLEDIASGKAAKQAKKSETEKSDDIVTCPKCGGSGEFDGEECQLCRGIGKVRKIVGPVEDDDDEDYDDDIGDLDDMSELDGLDDVILED